MNVQSGLQDTLKTQFKEGRVQIEDLFQVLLHRTYRTHILREGDYVLSSPIFPEHEPGILEAEKVRQVDYPEPGDFITDKDSTGPISGNVFVRVDENHFPPVFIMEGDHIGKPKHRCRVYDTVNKYLSITHNQISINSGFLL